MVSTAKNWTGLDANTFENDGYKYIGLDTTFVAKNLLALNLIDNNAACPVGNSITFGTNPFTDITADIGVSSSSTPL
jgi:hypothetical protein